jgi:predicted nucleotidyltransferase
MELKPAYPTVEHERAAQAIVDLFSRLPGIEAVLLVNSCARGKAGRDSCLDVNVLVLPETLAAEGSRLNDAWLTFYRTATVFRDLRAAGKFAEVHLDITDGNVAPIVRDWEGGPDAFELEVGNALAYSVPLWQGGDYYARLKSRWLPYYDEAMRRERLLMARHYCIHNLNHIPLYVGRRLYFQSFDRLYSAHREFLQALFIYNRTYPIAYDKWIHEQLVDILHLPDLYADLTHLFEIAHFESDELAHKAATLRGLLDRYAPAPE